MISFTGPSPRGWGERLPGVAHRVKRRTIPTRVGRTKVTGQLSWSKSDHPHAGGENARFTPSGIVVAGPSPRGWGELIHCYAACVPPRTIPTRVGRTTVADGQCVSIADHPHAGGENKSGWAHIHIIRGPSPRGWGERSTIHVSGVVCRTIPTRVGRTEGGTMVGGVAADHPHAGGENF